MIYCLSVLSVCLLVSETLCTVVLRVSVGVESYTIVLLVGHFLFTSSGTFDVATISVECVIQPQHSKN